MTASKENWGIGYCPFMVNLEPYCMWDWEPVQSNLDFLNSIDPRYFEHIAKIHGQLLDGEDQHYAATALRTAYSQGLETLFALLCATAQAPNCIVGWMHQYENRDVYAVARNIHKREPVPSCLSVQPVTWPSLSAEIHRHVSEEHRPVLQQAFTELWQRFAEEFLDEDFSDEYNSIKHGLRVLMGGTTIALGLETTFGVPAPPENMRRVGGSKFGTRFLIKEKSGDHKRNFRLKQHSQNWNPNKYVQALVLISASIGNILTALKACFGADTSKLQFTLPPETLFDAPWEADRGIGMTFHGFDSVITEQHIKVFSKQEIQAAYEQEYNGHSSINTAPEEV